MFLTNLRGGVQKAAVGPLSASTSSHLSCGLSSSRLLGKILENDEKKDVHRAAELRRRIAKIAHEEEIPMDVVEDLGQDEDKEQGDAIPPLMSSPIEHSDSIQEDPDFHPGTNENAAETVGATAFATDRAVKAWYPPAAMFRNMISPNMLLTAGNQSSAAGVISSLFESSPGPSSTCGRTVVPVKGFRSSPAAISPERKQGSRSNGKGEEQVSMEVLDWKTSKEIINYSRDISRMSKAVRTANRIEFGPGGSLLPEQAHKCLKPILVARSDQGHPMSAVAESVPTLRVDKRRREEVYQQSNHTFVMEKNMTSIAMEKIQEDARKQLTAGASGSNSCMDNGTAITSDSCLSGDSAASSCQKGWSMEAQCQREFVRWPLADSNFNLNPTSEKGCGEGSTKIKENTGLDSDTGPPYKQIKFTAGGSYDTITSKQPINLAIVEEEHPTKMVGQEEIHLDLENIQDGRMAPESSSPPQLVEQVFQDLLVRKVQGWKGSETTSESLTIDGRDTQTPEAIHKETEAGKQERPETLSRANVSVLNSGLESPKESFENISHQQLGRGLEMEIVDSKEKIAQVHLRKTEAQSNNAQAKVAVTDLLHSQICGWPSLFDGKSGKKKMTSTKVSWTGSGIPTQNNAADRLHQAADTSPVTGCIGNSQDEGNLADACLPIPSVLKRPVICLTSHPKDLTTQARNTSRNIQLIIPVTKSDGSRGKGNSKSVVGLTPNSPQVFQTLPSSFGSRPTYSSTDHVGSPGLERPVTLPKFLDSGEQSGHEKVAVQPRSSSWKSERSLQNNPNPSRERNLSRLGVLESDKTSSGTAGSPKFPNTASAGKLLASSEQDEMSSFLSTAEHMERSHLCIQYHPDGIIPGRDAVPQRLPNITSDAARAGKSSPDATFKFGLIASNAISTERYGTTRSYNSRVIILDSAQPGYICSATKGRHKVERPSDRPEMVSLFSKNTPDVARQGRCDSGIALGKFGATHSREVSPLPSATGGGDLQSDPAEHPPSLRATSPNLLTSSDFTSLLLSSSHASHNSALSMAMQGTRPLQSKGEDEKEGPTRGGKPGSSTLQVTGTFAPKKCFRADGLPEASENQSSACRKETGMMQNLVITTCLPRNIFRPQEEMGGLIEPVESLLNLGPACDRLGPLTEGKEELSRLPGWMRAAITDKQPNGPSCSPLFSSAPKHLSIRALASTSESGQNSSYLSKAVLRLWGTDMLVPAGEGILADHLDNEPLKLVGPTRKLRRGTESSCPELHRIPDYRMVPQSHLTSRGSDSIAADWETAKVSHPGNVTINEAAATSISMALASTRERQQRFGVDSGLCAENCILRSDSNQQRSSFCVSSSTFREGPGRTSRMSKALTSSAALGPTPTEVIVIDDSSDSPVKAGESLTIDTLLECGALRILPQTAVSHNRRPSSQLMEVDPSKIPRRLSNNNLLADLRKIGLVPAPKTTLPPHYRPQAQHLSLDMSTFVSHSIVGGSGLDLLPPWLLAEKKRKEAQGAANLIVLDDDDPMDLTPAQRTLGESTPSQPFTTRERDHRTNVNLQAQVSTPTTRLSSLQFASYGSEMRANRNHCSGAHSRTSSPPGVSVVVPAALDLSPGGGMNFEVTLTGDAVTHVKNGYLASTDGVTSAENGVTPIIGQENAPQEKKYFLQLSKTKHQGRPLCTQPLISQPYAGRSRGASTAQKDFQTQVQDVHCLDEVASGVGGGLARSKPDAPAPALVAQGFPNRQGMSLLHTSWMSGVKGWPKRGAAAQACKAAVERLKSQILARNSTGGGVGCAQTNTNGSLNFESHMNGQEVAAQSRVWFEKAKAHATHDRLRPQSTHTCDGFKDPSLSISCKRGQNYETDCKMASNSDSSGHSHTTPAFSTLQVARKDGLHNLFSLAGASNITPAGVPVTSTRDVSAPMASDSAMGVIVGSLCESSKFPSVEGAFPEVTMRNTLTRMQHGTVSQELSNADQHGLYRPGSPSPTPGMRGISFGDETFEKLGAMQPARVSQSKQGSGAPLKDLPRSGLSLPEESSPVSTSTNLPEQFITFSQALETTCLSKVLPSWQVCQQSPSSGTSAPSANGEERVAPGRAVSAASISAQETPLNFFSLPTRSTEGPPAEMGGVTRDNQALSSLLETRCPAAAETTSSPLLCSMCNMCATAAGLSQEVAFSSNNPVSVSSGVQQAEAGKVSSGGAQCLFGHNPRSSINSNIWPPSLRAVRISSTPRPSPAVAPPPSSGALRQEGHHSDNGFECTSPSSSPMSKMSE